jgi:HK97 gp10 family phage protein
MPNLLSSRPTSDGVQIEFSGFAELESVLKKFTGPQVNRALRGAFAKATARLEAALKAGAPDAPGPPHGKGITQELKASIKSETKAGRGGIEVNISGNYYGRILEYGWLPGKRPTTRFARALRLATAPASAFIPPKPWIVPIFEAQQNAVIDEILNDLQREVFAIFNEIGSQGGL